MSYTQSCVVNMMQKRLNISIDSKIAMQMREASLKKYGNSRSLSHLIEDLWNNHKVRPNIDEIKVLMEEYNEWSSKELKKNADLKQTFKCQNCGGSWASYLLTLYCFYCGSSELILESSGNDEQRIWWERTRKLLRKK